MPWALCREAERRKEALHVRQVREKNTRFRARNRRVARCRLIEALSQQGASECKSTDMTNTDAGFERAIASQARQLAFIVIELTSGKGVVF